MKFKVTSLQIPLQLSIGVENRIKWLMEFLDSNVTTPEDVGLHFVVAPEYFLGRKPRNWEILEEEGAIHGLYEWSEEHARIVLIPGSIAWIENDAVYNKAPVVYKGRIQGTITKRYPFGREKQVGIRPSTEVFVRTIKGVSFGGVICADLWYPKLIDRYEQSLDLILVPTQAVVPSPELVEYGRFLWQSLTVTRAKENVAVVASADPPPGKIYSESEWSTSGASFIVDPSFRFRTRDEFGQGVRNCKGIGTCSLVVSLERIKEYKKYRNEMFSDYSA